MQVERIYRQRHPTVQLRLGAGQLTATGLALLLLSWGLGWFGPEPLRWYYFFPLWLGYIVTVDAFNLHRSGTSLLTRDPAGFGGLFLLSAPFWWVFEALNQRLGNWNYRLPIDYSPIVYSLLASIAFSTVIPAIFETAELYRSFSPVRKRLGLRISPGRRGLLGIVAAGAIMLGLVILFPRQAFPLAWLSLFFMIDPLNALAGRRSLTGQVADGRWGTVLCLFAAGVTCGFFWEMWNFWAVPNWEYDVPYVGFWKIFEMPILGYGGYLPFALEIYALWALTARFLPGNQAAMVRFDRDQPADADR